jgi:hypothetical protein
VDEEEKCDPSITSVFGQSVFYRRDLQVYPNPSNGRYTVEVPETFRSGWLAVISPNGSIIDQQKVASGARPVTVDITNHPAGLYHIELYPKGREDKVFWSEKVVKQ